MALPVSGTLTFEFQDSCNCDCCFPWKDPQVYVNKDGIVERFDQAKAMGDENRKSIKRIKVILEKHLKEYSDEAEVYKKRIEDIASLNLDLMHRLNVKLTRSRVQRINDAIWMVLGGSK